MLYTTSQVAEKLGMGRQAVLRLVRNGDLVPVNSPKPGAQRCQFKFSTASLAEFARGQKQQQSSNGTNGHAGPPQVPAAPPAALGGLLKRLDAIEAKLDQVLELWR